jgi:predicted dienelactone hydrolase
MRVFELAAVLTLIGAAVPTFSTSERWRRWQRPLVMGGAALTLVHILTEGARWTMVPVYVGAVVLVVVAWFARVRRASGAPASRWRTARRAAGTSLLIGSVALGGLLSWVFPVFALPTPTGTAPVGTTTLMLVDDTRREVFSSDPKARRTLAVQAWYPADPRSAQQPVARWSLSRAFETQLAASLRVPRFLFGHLSLVRSHSHTDAPLAASAARLPVLVFSHGYGIGSVNQNTAQMEELASHGFVVLSIGHPYEALAVTYPDGRSVGLSETRITQVSQEMLGTKPFIERTKIARNDAERLAIQREWLKAMPLMDQSLRTWTRDTGFVLDELERLQVAGKPPLGSPLELTRVGVFGMSFGGAVATQFCLEDDRCAAGIDMDGSTFGDIVERPLLVPFMFMNSMSDPMKNHPHFAAATGPAYYLVAKGSRHMDFTDFSLMSPVKQHIFQVGSIDGARMESIMNRYVLAFFERHLRGVVAPFLNGPSSAFPEVDLETRS